jgi:hypothetical protein
MRAGSRIEYHEFVGYVTKALERLEYKYFKNATDRITEFEIQSPCKFRVLVEDCRGERSAFGLFRSNRSECAIELWRTVGAQESDDELRQRVNAFLAKLIATIPKEPWAGFGPFRSGSEKTRWAGLNKL